MNEKRRSFAGWNLRRLIVLAVLLDLLPAESGVASEPKFAIPESVAWVETYSAFGDRSGGATIVNVIDGTKWRVEMGYAEKVLVRVFDGKTLKSNSPADKPEDMDPRFNLRNLLQMTDSHPVDVPGVKENGGAVYHGVAGANDVVLYVDANGAPLRVIYKVSGKVQIDGQFKFLPYDVAVHATELFDTSNLKPYFSEYLPPLPRNFVPRTVPRIPGPIDNSPLIVAPSQAVWLRIEHGPSKFEGSRTMVQIIDGEKWRVEGGLAERPYVAVFDGKSAKANDDSLRADAMNPLFMVKSQALAASCASVVDTIQADGKTLTVYHSKPSDDEVIIYVNPDKTPVRELCQSGEKVNFDLEYKPIPFDVKAHEAELFDTGNLKSYFSQYLASGLHADPARLQSAPPTTPKTPANPAPNH